MRYALFCCALIAFLATGARAASPAEVLADDAGLARVRSQSLDELYRRADASLAAYRQVAIEAPRVAFAADWLKRMNDSRSVTRPIEPADAEQIADRMAVALRQAVGQALAAQGYEVVPVATPGTLRLSPAIDDLYVYAPFVPGPGIDVGIVHRDAGEATLRLEVRDAKTGTLLARMADHEVAKTIGGFEQATSVSNLFWFEGMFRRWADDCVRELRAGAPRP